MERSRERQAGGEDFTDEEWAGVIYCFPVLAGEGDGVCARGAGAGSSGRWNVLSGSLLTSSMIFANARVAASRPVHGTVSGVSQSVWK